jgi:ankyrin repeat protein
MKHLLLTTIAAVLVMGCGPSISIHKAAQEGNIEAVKQHLAAGTDVDAKDNIGRTPLHWSTVFGKNEIVEMLMAEGADINAKSDGGRTPLDWAIRSNAAETVDLLRKHGGKTGKELKAEGK